MQPKLVHSCFSEILNFDEELYEEYCCSKKKIVPIGDGIARCTLPSGKVFEIRIDLNTFPGQSRTEIYLIKE